MAIHLKVVKTPQTKNDNPEQIRDERSGDPSNTLIAVEVFQSKLWAD